MTSTLTTDPAAPERERFAYSGLTLHRRCPQAWNYRNAMGLREAETDGSPARDFGSWWGAWRAAEALVRGRRAGSLKIAEGTFSPLTGVEFNRSSVTPHEVTQAAERWWSKQGATVRERWQAELRGSLPERLADTSERWMREYGEEAQEHEHPIAVELEWSRELPASPYAEDGAAAPAPAPADLYGFIDEVYFDTKRGIVVVRDYKAHKALEASTTLTDMMDSQLHFYAWGVTPQLRAWGLPAPRAVVFDRARSEAPAQPAVTSAGALSKATSAYDVHTYLAWAEGPDGEGVPWGTPEEYFKSGPRKGQPKFGLYTPDPEVVERLQTPAHRSQFFQRSLDVISVQLVRSHLRAAVDTVADVRRTKARVERTGEAARNLVRFTCSWCPFADLCRAQMRGGAEGDYDLAQYGLEDRETRKAREQREAAEAEREAAVRSADKPSTATAEGATMSEPEPGTSLA